MKKIALTLFLLFFGLNVFSQSGIKISSSTIVVGGEKFYLHTVQKEQTLYSICKAYKVTQKNIAKANPNLNGSSSINIGQVLKVPIKTVNKTGVTFKWHKVLKKETLYSIASKYKISVNDIIKHNADAKHGIKVGQVLKIPNVNGSGADYTDNHFYYHTVESGDTPFSVCQQYGTTYEQLYAFNRGSQNGLKLGEVLKIPKGNFDTTEKLRVYHEDELGVKSIGYDPLYFEEKSTTPCSEFTYDKSMVFNVGVMLPLYVEKNAWLAKKYKNKNDRLFYKNSRRFYEMYEGILLALQQLKIAGLSVNLYVYDTKNNAEEIRKIMQKDEFKTLDLLIGPIYSANVQILSYYIKKYKINLVTPLSHNAKLLKNNPFIFEAMPTKETRVKKTSDFLSLLYDTSVVIVHGGTPKELELIDLYKRKLVKSFVAQDQIDEIILKTIDYEHGGAATLEDALSVGNRNIILIPSSNEVFVTKIIEKLYNYSKDYDISLFGPPNWELYQNVQINHLRNLSFRYAAPSYIDYENWRVKSFIRKYRTAYKTEPGIYAYKGYDIMYYFGNALMRYGKHFQFCLTPFDKIPNRKGLVHDFEFIRYGNKGGFANSGVFMLEYNENFVLKKSK